MNLKNIGPLFRARYRRSQQAGRSASPTGPWPDIHTPALKRGDREEDATVETQGGYATPIKVSWAEPGIRCYLSSVYRKISLEVFTIQA